LTNRGIAAAAADLGFRAVQLAPSKALPDAPADPTAFTGPFARSVGRAFAERGLTVAALGCYINPVHPDPVARERDLARFELHLRAARAFGCGLVATETGSRGPDTHAPETYALALEAFGRLERIAAQEGVRIAVEAVADKETISSASLLGRLIADLGSPRVLALWDPVNLVPASGPPPDAVALADQADHLKGRIALVHAKDFVLEDGRKIDALPPGRGRMDWFALASIIREAAPDAPVILEGSPAADLAASLPFLRGLGLGD
jgi:sugar phosphate isomerase/epimerase